MKEESELLQGEGDSRWEGPGGPVLVEVKKTNSARDVRDALLTLVYALSREAPDAHAVCALTGTRLSYNRMISELNLFRRMVHPDYADRVHLLMQAPSGDFVGPTQDLPKPFLIYLSELLTRETQASHRPLLPARQAVVATLVAHRLWDADAAPLTVKRIQQLCQVSYPTVAAALQELDAKGLLEATSERGVRLRRLTADELLQLAHDHAAKRKVVLFTDPSRLATPAGLAKRLFRLQTEGKVSPHVRVGGVLGASHHFPHLDVTGAARLDLSVDRLDPDLVKRLDAGLMEQTDKRDKPLLAVHLTFDPWVIEGKGAENEGRWASEFECLADLIEMGLSREAAEMANAM